MPELTATISAQHGLSGTLNNTMNDYDLLKNKPSIESVVLEGDKTFSELGISRLSNSDIEEITGG
jgi:hypothetical protein